MEWKDGPLSNWSRDSGDILGPMGHRSSAKGLVTYNGEGGGGYKKGGTGEVKFYPYENEGGGGAQVSG